MILNDKTSSGRIIGRVLLIDKSGEYVYNQRSERIEVDKSKFLPLFLYCFLNSNNIREKIVRQAQGNTQIYVNFNTISQHVYLVPKLSEQIQIGKFVRILDNLITLHQRE